MTEKDKIWITVVIVNPILTALDRHTSALDTLGDKIGRSTAKWLELANLPDVRNELREDAYSLLGFHPAEIVDILYPNLGKDDRKTRRQAISKSNSM